jgi:hypothetical protein
MGQRRNSIEKLQEEGQQHQQGNQDPQRGPQTDGHIPVGQQKNLAEQDSQKLDQVQALKNLDAVTQQVKQEFREWKLVKRRDLVTKLGNAFEKVCPSNTETVCEEIKNAWRDEIAERLISTRDIERYCPVSSSRFTERNLPGEEHWRSGSSGSTLCCIN